MSAAPARLVARTARRDDLPDLLAVAGEEGPLFSAPDGTTLAGRGEVCRVAPSEVGDLLADAEVEDPLVRPGTGPVALGALPFRPERVGTLSVPRLVAGWDPAGSAWLTTIGTVEEPPPDPASLTLEAAAAPGGGPSEITVRSVRAPEEWCEAVAEATRRIRRGDLEKVVLAREIEVVGDAPFARSTILRRLLQSFPGCFTYGIGGYVGASPELLVGRVAEEVHSQPMAGTAPRRGDPEADADAVARLRSSPSYRHEHQVTIDAVYDALVPFCSFLDFEAEPSVVTLPNVTHLATTVSGRLSQPAAPVMDLVAALHPTPAVCGRPRAAALAVIDELEGFDRGPYAGAVGWTDARGDGCWAVAIRSALLDGTRARVFGGNGIVADSDPVTELAETRAKLQAVLSVLVRP